MSRTLRDDAMFLPGYFNVVVDQASGVSLDGYRFLAPLCISMYLSPWIQVPGVIMYPYVYVSMDTGSWRHYVSVCICLHGYRFLTSLCISMYMSPWIQVPGAIMYQYVYVSMGTGS